MSTIRLSVLDFLEGEAETYIITEEQIGMDSGELLEYLGHDISNCEYMYH